MTLFRRALLCLLVATPLAAQTITATLEGTVKDPHGAAVPGASVIVTAAETNQSRNATTDNSGHYTLTFLPPGIYTLKATAQGFGTVSDKQIQLDVDQTAQLDLSLPLDVNREVIQVNADTPMLTTETSNLETVVENKLIENLPSGERSTLSFINLVPGVIDAGFRAGTGREPEHQRQRARSDRDSRAIAISSTRISRRAAVRSPPTTC